MIVEELVTAEVMSAHHPPLCGHRLLGGEGGAEADAQGENAKHRAVSRHSRPHGA